MKLKKKFIVKNIKKNPKFSIITVVKNDQLNISKTIKTTINQSYKNFEYLIVDGKSTDQTLIEILKFKKKINILISENDKGIYYAMNKAIKLARGEIIVFVNSGDLLKKDALKDVNHVFETNKNYDFVFGTVKRHYITSTILKYGLDRNRLKYNFDFATSHSVGFFLKKKIFEKYGLFNTQYKCSADYDIYYRIILKHKIDGGFTKKSNLIGIVKSGGYSSKINFFNHIFEETKIRLNNKQNFVFVSIIFCNAIFKFMLKKIFQFK
jgi:glycosyltransferase involved in cell wall biosynthesis